MQESLLSHIASSFISEYENVANSSVAYLLNKYPKAQVALQNILDVDNDLHELYLRRAKNISA